MDKDALDVIGNAIHEWSGCHTDVHDELCSAYIDTGAPAVAAALGANGYVVVPRHLLDELLEAAKPSDDMRARRAHRHPAGSGLTATVRAEAMTGPMRYRLVTSPNEPTSEAPEPTQISFTTMPAVTIIGVTTSDIGIAITPDGGVAVELAPVDE